MLIDARELAEGAVVESDVCVIGAGAAGITVARHLASSGLTVSVLESGGLEPDGPTQDLCAGDVSGAPLLSHGTPMEVRDLRLRYFGGTTNHWAGYCRPLEPIDFDKRSYLDISGWPFGPDELEPWYERAAGVLRLASHRFDLPWWQQHHALGEALVETDLVSTALFQVQYPFSFGAAYRAELERAPSVAVYLWANATSLRVQPNSEAIESVEARTLTGRSFEFRARRYVLASGGIENARLLLASNDVRSAGIGNQNDLVGRYFTEHLQAMAGFAVLSRPPSSLSLYAGDTVPAPVPENPQNAVAPKAALVLTRHALEQGGLLGMEVQMLVADPEAGGPQHSEGVSPSDVLPLLAAIEAPSGASLAYLQVSAEQKLNPDSRVSLSGDADALGMPRVRVEWRHSPEDRASIVAGMELVARELGRTGGGRVQIALGGISSAEPIEGQGPLSFYRVSPSEIDLEGFPLGIGFHHLCTTRMDQDPTRGVVDANCKVHGTANLYVAGSSVFATGGTATPTLTIVALALRLADHLASSG